MAFLENAYEHAKHAIGHLFNRREKDEAPTEQTVAPFNIHPMEFDITMKPIDETSVDNVIKDLLDSLINNTSDNLSTTAGESVSSMDIPEPGGHTFIKFVEDTTGRTVQVIHESITEIPVNLSHDLSNVTDPIKKEVESTNYINIYIIAALVLIIVIALSSVGIMWCRKNRLTAQKRNQYPVMPVENSHYLDPKTLRKEDKLNYLP